MIRDTSRPFFLLSSVLRVSPRRTPSKSRHLPWRTCAQRKRKPTRRLRLRAASSRNEWLSPPLVPRRRTNEFLRFDTSFQTMDKVFAPDLAPNRLQSRIKLRAAIFFVVENGHERKWSRDSCSTCVMYTQTILRVQYVYCLINIELK